MQIYFNFNFLILDTNFIASLFGFLGQSQQARKWRTFRNSHYLSLSLARLDTKIKFNVNILNKLILVSTFLVVDTKSIVSYFWFPMMQSQQARSKRTFRILYYFFTLSCFFSKNIHQCKV